MPTSCPERAPVEVDSRLAPGHWEGDFIKGPRNASAIGTAVERYSRFVLLAQINGCPATHALDGFSRRFNNVIPELRQSFTYDRGSGRARHQELTEATGMPVYFCEPYNPWQRGPNENMNGLVRQFLPKGTDLSTITPQKLAYIEAMLNMTGLARSSTSARIARSISKSCRPRSPSGTALLSKTLHFRLDSALLVANNLCPCNQLAALSCWFSFLLLSSSF